MSTADEPPSWPSSGETQVTGSKRTSIFPSLERYRWQLIMALSFCCYLFLVTRSHKTLYALGVATYGRWFHDLFAILASNDAVALGIDPYIPNPLDYYHRPHVYSSWWLNLHDLGLTRADTLWLGLTLVAVFMIAAIMGLRPKSGKEAVFYLAGLCSSPVLLAINRANNDIVVFLVLCAAPLCLVSAQRTVRLFAAFLIVFAAGLKFFPLAGALILLSAKERGELRVRLMIFALLCGLAGVGIAEDFTRGSYFLPDVRGLFTFGSVAIPNTLQIADRWWGYAAWLIGIAVFFMFFLRGKAVSVEGETDAKDRISFIMGASLLCACFWLNMNFSYRFIFALWMMPYLWRVPGDMKESSHIRRQARWTRLLLLGVLWLDTGFCLWVNLVVSRIPGANQQAWADRLFLAEQPLAWAFFLSLLAFLAQFIAEKLSILIPFLRPDRNRPRTDFAA